MQPEPVVKQETVDPLLAQYREMVETKGETGRLNGQIKEIDLHGQPVILTHPGIKKAQKISALAFQLGENVPTAANEQYVDHLIKEVVSYPEELKKQGTDYFEDPEHKGFLELVSQADEFLSKYLN